MGTTAFGCCELHVCNCGMWTGAVYRFSRYMGLSVLGVRSCVFEGVLGEGGKPCVCLSDGIYVFVSASDTLSGVDIIALGDRMCCVWDWGCGSDIKK